MFLLTFLPEPVATETFRVICPECKTRHVTTVEPDAPQNEQTGVYCLTCEVCRHGVYYNLIKGKGESVKAPRKETLAPKFRKGRHFH